MQRLILFIMSAFLIFTAPVNAKEASSAWTVSEKSGDVQVLRGGLQPVSLRSDGTLKPGDIIATGATGRAVLTRQADYVIVAPNSRVRLPAADAPDGMTRFFQQVGTMLYKVRRMGVPHFEVETPMLAAVVKGTTFTVIVDRDRSAVQVTEGKVEVTAITGGMQRLVMPGETVFINREDPSDLVLASAASVGVVGDDGDGVRIDGSAPEPLTSIATLTGGLVQAAAPVQVAALVPPSATTDVPAVVAPVGLTPTTPSVATPTATVPAVATPAVTTPTVTVPSTTTPAVTVLSVTTPTVTVPAIATPVVTTPAITVPSVTTPTVTVPAITTPVVTTPAITVPSVSTPTVTVPAIATPVVTTPAITVPSVTTPPVTVPAITTPVVTTPTVTVPAITTPPVTIPAVPLPVVPVTTPPVTIPGITLPPIPGL